MAKGRLVAVCALALIVGFATFLALTSRGNARDYFLSEEREFQAFAEKYGKVYRNEEERMVRFQRFRDVSAYIRLHNTQSSSFELEVNEFADMSAEEFRNRYLTSFPKAKTLSKSAPLSVNDLPETVNWVAQGAVSQPMSQGSCGGCWAFAAVGAIEGLHFLQTKTLVQLSPQQLIDCSSNFGNEGCNGGLMDDGFKYVIEAGGVETEKEYPFRRFNGECVADKRLFSASIKGYADVQVNNELQLKAAVAQQPVTVGIQADQSNFMYYRTGVIDSGCGSNLDHGVLVVGYGLETNTPYWLIKNSWGPGWGQKGFVKVLRQDANNSSPGMCGIASMPSYPI